MTEPEQYLSKVAIDAQKWLYSQKNAQGLLMHPDQLPRPEGKIGVAAYAQCWLRANRYDRMRDDGKSFVWGGITFAEDKTVPPNVIIALVGGKEVGRAELDHP